MADQRFRSVFDINGEFVAMIGVLVGFCGVANVHFAGVIRGNNVHWQQFHFIRK